MIEIIGSRLTAKLSTIRADVRVMFFMALVYLGLARILAIKLFWHHVAQPIDAWCRIKLGELPFGEQPPDLQGDYIIYTDDRDMGAYRHER